MHQTRALPLRDGAEISRTFQNFICGFFLLCGFLEKERLWRWKGREVSGCRCGRSGWRTEVQNGTGRLLIFHFCECQQRIMGHSRY